MPLVRAAAWCAYTSGVVGALGVLLLAAFFLALAATGRGFGLGELNDAAIVVQYTLLIPVAVELRQRLRPAAPTASLITLVIGVAGMVAVIVLQLLLLSGRLPFRQQIGMVSGALLIVAAWFLMNGRLARASPELPACLPPGMAFDLLGGSYLGYPFWAFALGRRLRSETSVG